MFYTIIINLINLLILHLINIIINNFNCSNYFNILHLVVNSIDLLLNLNFLINQVFKFNYSLFLIELIQNLH